MLITQADLEEVVEEVTVVFWPNIRSNIEVAKLQIFSRETVKVLDFLMICRLCQDHWWWTWFYFSSDIFILFYFSFSFIFLYLEQLGLGLIGHAVTSVTTWWRSHKTDHGTKEKEVEDARTKWRHTTWTTHVDLMLYSWSFRARCTVVSMDHEYEYIR